MQHGPFFEPEKIVIGVQLQALLAQSQRLLQPVLSEGQFGLQLEGLASLGG